MRAAVVIRGAGIREISFVTVDINQGANLFFVGGWLEDLDEGGCEAEEVLNIFSITQYDFKKRGMLYPEGKDILVVWLAGSPVGILACLVRWDQVHKV